MASNLTISTQNINGFPRNESFIKGLCEKHPDSIRALQEHWLKPPFKKHLGVNRLRQVHDMFDGWGTSAMKCKMENEVRLGRPFGGTGFLWNKKYSMAIKPRVEYKHERVTVLELNDKNDKLLLINAYMPFYKSSQLDEQIACYTDTLAFIESIMEMNQNYNFIVLADLNCNLSDTRHPFSVLVNEFMSRRNLMSSYELIENFDPSSFWTRKGKGANGSESFTLIDYILISRTISPKVSNVRISDFPDNLSDHCPVEIDLAVDLDFYESPKISVEKTINWSRVTGDVKKNYESIMEHELNSIVVPHVVHGNNLCYDCNHVHLLEDYYQKLLSAIAKADNALPRSRPTISKNYWNDELTKLKNESIDAFTLWRNSGCPRSGITFDIKKNAHYRYKAFLRKCQSDHERMKNDELHENLINGSTVNFWKSWKAIHGSSQNNAIRIDGHFKDPDIAECFADSFRSVYRSNDPVRVESLRSQFDQCYETYCNERRNDDISFYYMSWSDMLNIADKMKLGKATAGFVRYEHILHGSPKLLFHLQILFNGLIQHGYVPQDFLSGVITPIVKDNEGDIFSTSNYRGITLSVVFASLFECAILEKIGHLLETDHLQFGYKAKHSCPHALYVMRSCIEYFTKHGSNVFVSFLDCSKGFDKVDHRGIFIKLMQRKVPLCFLNLIIYWYSNLSSVVKWNNVVSRSFNVTSGVRQGGILSPRLFILYVNDLLTKLRQSGVGCHVADKFVASIMYADDLALLAPTRGALQKLLNICHEYGIEWCISYNPLKTKMMVFGKNTEFNDIFLNGTPIASVTEYKYLGVHVTAGKDFSTSVRKPLSAFLCSANTILNVLRKPSETILMRLLSTNYVPILT